ncbi:MAG: hypothetical protein V1874_17050 [Spirochaetota bacterium]
MKNKYIIIILIIIILTSCSTEKAFLMDGAKNLKPGTTALLCYSDEDELNIEYTRQLTKALSAKGIKVLSYNQIKQKLPAYPENFFLDKPYFKKNDASDEYYIPQNNLDIIGDAQKQLKTDYILFIIYSIHYSGALRLIVPTQSAEVHSYSFLIKYPENKIVGYLYDTYDKSSITLKGISTSNSTVVECSKKIIPEAAEIFAVKYHNEIKKYTK